MHKDRKTIYSIKKPYFIFVISIENIREYMIQ